MVPMKLLSVLIIILNGARCFEFVKPDFQKSHLQVQTENGRVQGTRLPTEALKSRYYYAFLGIPYAQAPIGDLRFRSPKRAANWSGVLDASREGSACVEINLRIATSDSTVTGNEDCLFLNVFTKTNPAASKKLKPVMVFIHGGGFSLGSSDVKYFGPDLLVARDVVVVTLNYRLNVFGFLSTEDLVSPGNYGLKDQNLALRWVQKNIRNFGGDPDNVMLFGQSAGSVSVHMHMISPKSRGLFHKVLLESGSVLCMWGSQRKPRNIAYLVGLANGITKPRDNEELVESLRRLDLEDFRQTLLGVSLPGTAQSLFTGLPFAPTLEEDHEDAFLTKNSWYEMLKNGNFNRVPVVMGINLNESLYFLSEANFIKPFLVFFDLDNGLITPTALNIKNPETATTVGREILDHFFGINSRVGNVDILDMLQYQSQDNFVRPLWKTAELMSQHVPLYFYHFRYQSDLGRLAQEGREYSGVSGVSHEEEVHFLFSKLNHRSKNKEDYIVGERLLTMWTNFAKYSNPTPVNGKKDALGNMIWPRFTPKNRAFLEIDKSLRIRNVSDDRDQLLWWDELFRKYGNPPFHTY